MDMKQFIQEVDKEGFGVIFNTYLQHFQERQAIIKKNMYYVTVGRRGKTGVFFKREGLVGNMDTDLAELLQEIKTKSPIIGALTF
jgi:hypothetical protein